MSHSIDSLAADTNSLAPHYTHFDVAQRLLLTGHSHQAWPDVALKGQTLAWMDAARHADGKWDAVAAQVERVSEGYRALLGGCDGDITLDTNTHSLVIRFLSAVGLDRRPRVVTTDGEFHTIRRQLDRLAEEGVEIVRVAAEPVDTLSERLADAVDERTACAMVSSVLFGSGLIVPGLPLVAAACERVGAEMLIDSYHSLGVVPFDLEGMNRAFVVGGGYKYLQLGEGNCCLRVPPDCSLRPVITGWFAEFGELAKKKDPGEVAYGTGPARFAGSTFDPTSQYRASAVLDFFEQEGLTPAFLRSVSQHQVGLLKETFKALDLDPKTIALEAEVPLEERGGFLALRCADAGAVYEGLLERGVRTDYRVDVLRFGPAPYLTDDQIVRAVSTLRDVVAG